MNIITPGSSTIIEVNERGFTHRTIVCVLRVLLNFIVAGTETK